MNLGGFINTELEDSLVSIPASGDILYYTKSKSKGNDASRIHTATIPDKLQQKKVITVSGTVRDKINLSKTLCAKISITVIKGDKQQIIISSNKNDGKYIVILNKGKIYDFSVSSKGYTFYSTKIDLIDLKSYKEIHKDILLEPARIGARIVLNNLYFKYRSYKLLEDSKYELGRIINLMKDNPNMNIEISGHTDNVGSRSYNLELSQKRAGSVVNYLVKNGISRDRLVPKGYGQSRPIASNKTEKNREKNRRVEIKVIGFDFDSNKYLYSSQ